MERTSLKVGTVTVGGGGFGVAVLVSASDDLLQDEKITLPENSSSNKQYFTEIRLVFIPGTVLI